ncbi:MAG: hypothetical protein WBK91_10080 [Alphaproteobacteria bacterium]
MTRKFLALALLVFVTACSSDTAAPIQPLTLDYTGRGKINLAVARLEFMNSAPLAAPAEATIFQKHKPQLGDALYRWGADRLQAGGKQGTARMVIHDSSLRREALPRQSGMESWFTRQQGERWSGKATVDLRIEGAAGNFTGNATATVMHSTTLPEDASPGERENAYRRLLLGMMEDLNNKMEAAIRTHLNPVVLTMQ